MQHAVVWCFEGRVPLFEVVAMTCSVRSTTAAVESPEHPVPASVNPPVSRSCRLQNTATSIGAHQCPQATACCSNTKWRAHVSDVSPENPTPSRQSSKQDIGSRAEYQRSPPLRYDDHATTLRSGGQANGTGSRRHDTDHQMGPPKASTGHVVLCYGVAVPLGPVF